MSDVQLSLIIPTHDRAQLLEEMIASLADQTFPADRYEVIVVDDGSTDGTMAMLERTHVPFALRPVHQRQSGPSVARNHGARVARGRVLLFLDDDLLPLPGLIERHYEIHAEDDQAVVIGRYLTATGDVADGQGGWNAWEARVLEKHFEAMRTGRRPAAGRRLYSGNFSVDARLFQAVGGFDESLPRGEDMELGLRLQDAGAHFHYAPEAAGVHRGFRSFSSWLRSSYLNGQYDVRLAQDKHRPTLPLLLDWYHHQRSYVRAALAVGLYRDWTKALAIPVLRSLAWLMTAAGLNGAAHAGYGAIYRLQYWSGVVDQVGGRQAFAACVRDWKEGRMSISTDGQAA